MPSSSSSFVDGFIIQDTLAFFKGFPKISCLEYSRFRYLEAFQEHSTYSYAEFIKHCVKKLPFAVRQRQYNRFPMHPLAWSSPHSSFLTLFHVIDKPTKPKIFNYPK